MHHRNPFQSQHDLTCQTVVSIVRTGQSWGSGAHFQARSDMFKTMDGQMSPSYQFNFGHYNWANSWQTTLSSNCYWQSLSSSLVDSYQRTDSTCWVRSWSLKASQIVYCPMFECFLWNQRVKMWQETEEIVCYCCYHWLTMHCGEAREAGWTCPSDQDQSAYVDTWTAVAVGYC